MASAMRKMAVYLGLVEDDHRYDEHYSDEYGSDEYDEYGDQGDLLESATGRRFMLAAVTSAWRMAGPTTGRTRRPRRRPPRRRRPIWPGLPPCIRERTMRLVRSESTSARALR